VFVALAASVPLLCVGAGIALAVHLIARMKEFSFQDRLVFLGQLSNEAAPIGGAGEAPPMRSLCARPAAISTAAAARASGSSTASDQGNAAIELQSARS
jgi:hypothetical protein